MDSVSRLLIACCLSVCGVAHAADLRIGPIRVMLEGDTRVAAVTVHNGGTEPTVVQLEPMQWRQEQGADVYEPTTELLATPPIFSLAPGESQVVRSGLRAQATSIDAEQTYRLYVREVAPEVAPSVDGAPGQLRIALRVGVPVFVRPKVQLPPSQLHWTMACAAQVCEVVARNTGGVFARVHRWRIVDAVTGQSLIETASAGYVLAGSEFRWQVSAPEVAGRAASLEIEAQTEDGNLKAAVLRRD